MKLFKNYFIPLTFLTACFLFGCTKDQTKKPTPPAQAQVTVQIDYVGTGGFYKDDVTPASTIYVIGTNGPYQVDPSKTYTLQYKADENFPVLTKTWSPTSGPWTIHCYVSGNTEYISVQPGN